MTVMCCGKNFDAICFEMNSENASIFADLG